MVSIRKTSDVYFFTATNLKWIKLLENDEHKNIVIGSLQFLSDNKRVKWHQWWCLCSKSRKTLRKLQVK